MAHLCLLAGLQVAAGRGWRPQALLALSHPSTARGAPRRHAPHLPRAAWLAILGMASRCGQGPSQAMGAHVCCRGFRGGGQREALPERSGGKRGQAVAGQLGRAAAVELTPRAQAAPGLRLSHEGPQVWWEAGADCVPSPHSWRGGALSPGLASLLQGTWCGRRAS